MKLSRLLPVLFVFSIVLITSRSGSAYIVTVHIEGIVSEIQTFDGLTLDDSATIGSLMTGYYTYDTETPDQHWPDDTTGRYSLISISMNIGNYSFMHNPAATKEPFWGISAGNGGFYYSIASGHPVFYGPCYMNGESTNLEDLHLYLPGSGVIMHLVANIDSPTGDDLPNEDTFPDISVFDEDRIFLVDSSSTPAFTIMGEVTNITVVPEPTSVLLFGLAGLALLRKRKK